MGDPSKSMNGVALARVLLACWAIAATAAAVWAAHVYPVSDWSVVLPFAAVGVAIVATPMPFRLRIVLALLVGLTARILVSHALVGSQPVGDVLYNPRMAADLLAGKGLAAHLPGYPAPLRASYPPLYILALATMQAMGGSPWMLNLAADIAACCALYRLSDGDARITAAYFVFPSVVLASALPLKEPLAVALMLAAMLCVRRPLRFGLVTGLLALTQPAWLLVPVIAFTLLDRRPRALLVAGAAAVTVLAPWWARNAIVLGTFVPLTTTPGFSLWVATFGTYSAGTTQSLGETALSAESARLAFEAIVAHPDMYLARVFRGAAEAMLLDDGFAQAVGWSAAAWVAAATTVANSAWAACLGWAAQGKAWPDRRLTAFAIAGCISVGLGMWLEFSTRHRAFVLPLLLLWIASRRAAPDCSSRST